MYKNDAQRELVRLVGRPHQVNLQHPDKVLLVEVFMVCFRVQSISFACEFASNLCGTLQKACGFSIVDAVTYNKYRQYNIRMISDQFVALDEEPRENAEGDDEALDDKDPGPQIKGVPSDRKNLKSGGSDRKQDEGKDDHHAEQRPRYRSSDTIPVASLSENGELNLDIEFEEPRRREKRKRAQSSDSASDSDSEDAQESFLLFTAR